MEDKVNDHHFKPLNEYEYTLEFVEPRKSYEELQKENEALKLTFQVLKTAAELFNNVHKLGATFQKDKVSPEMVYNEKKHMIFEEGGTISNESIESLKNIKIDPNL